MRREGARDHAEYAEAGPGAIAAIALRYHKTGRSGQRAGTPSGLMR